jgi:cytochrome P450
MTTRPAHVPERLVVDYDGLDAEESADNLLDRARQWSTLGPVVWTDANYGHWVVLAAELNRFILSNPGMFSAAKPGQGVTLTRTERELHVPLELDGAEHRRYRKVLTPLFSPARVRKLEDQVRGLAATLIEAMLAKDTTDIVADFARPLASSLFLGLVDWPLEDRHILEPLVERELNGLPGASKEEKAWIKAEAIREMAGYVRAQVVKRQQNPTGDMTTLLINAILDDGSTIPESRLIPMLVLLCVAGLDTTQSVLSRSLDYLGRHEAAQDYFRANLDSLPAMVEELLRWGAPAVPNRTVLQHCDLGGVQLKAGDTVQCLLAVASRDEQDFDNPWTLDLARPRNRHLAFSAGPHTCIGSGLARVMLNTALDEFHRKVDRYEVLGSESHTGAVWGMRSVRMTLSIREDARGPRCRPAASGRSGRRSTV